MKIRLLLIVSVISYLIMLFGGGAIKQDYDHLTQFISELNGSGTGNEFIIGFLGFIPFGIFSGSCLLVAYRYFQFNKVSRIGYCLLIFLPISYIGSAFAPCDLGCPRNGTLNQTIHNVLGYLIYFSVPAALVMLSFYPKLSKLMRVYWVFIAFLWIILFELMYYDPLANVRGLLQRFAELSVYGSLFVVAWIKGTIKSIQPTASASAD